MSLIRQLPGHVADLIAAGEVVERPASVVKELTENAIDAGASAIVVEIQNGGMTYIRVADNGCGIAAEELPTAFLRHATSKLRTAEDLGCIGTLGFRGEALAAIASVSRIDILSRRAEDDCGASLHLEAGIAEEVQAVGAPAGTTIVVRDLFFNTPARLKFMKKDSAEASAISGIVQHLALSHPHISFRLIKDGAEVLLTPGDGKLSSAIYAALGRDFAMNLVEVHSESGQFKVDGFVTKPLAGRGTRGMQTFFVNGRYVKSQLLTAALEEAYRNQLMKGKYPGCVLHISLPLDQVDVNVHPAKTVIKFLNDRSAFDAVYYPVLDALNGKSSAPQPEKPAAPTAVTNPRQDFYQTMTAQEFRKKQAETSPAAGKPLTTFQTRIPATDRGESQSRPLQDKAVESPTYTYKVTPVTLPKAAPAEAAEKPVSAPTKKPETLAPAPVSAQEPLSLPQEPQQQTLQPESAAPWRLVGEILNTYIVCEDMEKGCLWLIDKHAAHERVLFDKLQDTAQPIMSQTLLSPAAVTLEREAYSAVLDNLALLKELGFACEDFGEGSILVREVPSDVGEGDITGTLEEMAQKLLLGQDPSARRDHLLHTMACKAAIKAGMHSDEKELRVLIGKVQSGEVRYCPHGRPVAVKLSGYELEKMFKRA